MALFFVLNTYVYSDKKNSLKPFINKFLRRIFDYDMTISMLGLILALIKYRNIDSR